MKNERWRKTISESCLYCEDGVASMVRSEVRKPVPGCLSHNHGLVREDRRSANRSSYLSHISGHFWSHRSLKGNDLRLSLLSSLPVLPSHQHEILRLLSRALEILGKQKPGLRLNSPAMQMCKEAEDIFQDAVEYFFKREPFCFSRPFPSMGFWMGLFKYWLQHCFILRVWAVEFLAGTTAYQTSALSFLKIQYQKWVTQQLQEDGKRLCIFTPVYLFN